MFRIWIIILAFVGIQLSWNLRPFLCEKNEEFKLFRKYEGNFYTAVIYSVQQLASKKDIKLNKENKGTYHYPDKNNTNLKDTSILNLLKK